MGRLNLVLVNDLRQGFLVKVDGQVEEVDRVERSRDRYHWIVSFTTRDPEIVPNGAQYTLVAE